MSDVHLDRYGFGRMLMGSSDEPAFFATFATVIRLITWVLIGGSRSSRRRRGRGSRRRQGDSKRICTLA